MQFKFPFGKKCWTILFFLSKTLFYETGSIIIKIVFFLNFVENVPLVLEQCFSNFVRPRPGKFFFS